MHTFVALCEAVWTLFLGYLIDDIKHLSQLETVFKVTYKTKTWSDLKNCFSIPLSNGVRCER